MVDPHGSSHDEDRARYHRALSCLSTVDGRETLFCIGLVPFLSEGALHRYRAIIQIEAMIAFADSDLPERPVISTEQRATLRSLVTLESFDATAVADYDHFGRNGVGPFEHDVKAVETYVRERLCEVGLDFLCEWVHFPMTSEDVSNLAWNLMLRNAINRVWLPQAILVMEKLALHAEQSAHVPVLGITHGMKASPTTIGKRFSYTLARLCEIIEQLRELRLSGKFGGPVGNHNAMTAVLPDFDIEAFAQNFVEGFEFIYEDNAHQRNSHQSIVRLLQEIKLFNEWLIDLCENVRHNVMIGWLYQVGQASHVGSSVMPHKINPWFFEVAQGGLEKGNCLIDGAVSGLLHSVFERDLTDHPWERAYGQMIAESLIGLHYIADGLDTLQVNDRAALESLRASPEVLSEAVQIAGRIAGAVNIYMTIKSLTRGRVLDGQMLREIIEEHIPAGPMRERLMALTGETYTGLAMKAARRTVERYRHTSQSVRHGLLKEMGRVQAVLFDFDQTLHFGDKAELQCRLEAINERLSLGFTAAEISVFGDRSDYREMRAAMVSAFNARQTDRSIDERTFQSANDAVSGTFDHHFQLAEHALELLEVLRSTGRKTGLVTTRGSNSLPRLLNKHGIANHFDVVISRDDCKERKPHPQPIALALERLGIDDPSGVIFVGDKQIDDVIAAKALGLRTALVNNEVLDRYGAKPTYHFRSLRPLVRLFSTPYWES